ncbi:Uu.00g120320.m01.CDS01 [Anthostomella pinea]|uniref:Uu.00g120320.m01.CDS01 n=1 Tax=Anthostomella pinea TaxID=933095 RepID=A0AAI8VGU0_9PEZI|nr:Uu.00g120320.m01.CDS01 [Anthostomella pinea]
MDLSQAQKLQQSWNRQRMLMIVRHDTELALYRIQLEEEKQAARDRNEHELEQFRIALPAHTFETMCVPMSQGSLLHALQQIDQAYEERTRPIKEAHRSEKDLHEHRKPPPARPAADELSAPSSAGSPDISSAPKLEVYANANLPFAPDGGLHICGQDYPTPSLTVSPTITQDETLQTHRTYQTHQTHPPRHGQQAEPSSRSLCYESDDGNQRLLFRCRIGKRKASPDGLPDPKRLRIDTSANALRTPLATSSVDDNQQQTRTITFSEVYQDGKAKHKDAIVKWPAGSRKWYILKCEEHGVHFKERAVQGAAKHLSGKLHGFPDRNQEMAVRTLGIHVVDCNEQRASMNNQSVAEAYANGYTPENPWKRGKRTRPDSTGTHAASSRPALISSTQMPACSSLEKRSPGKKLKPALPPLPGATSSPQKISGATEIQTAGVTSFQSMENDAPLHTVAKARTPIQEIRRKTPTSSSRKPSIPADGLYHPKVFHIYHGHWRDDDQVYPVMILGWGDQTEGGLQRNSNLADTGLLHKDSSPPKCYIYSDDAIVGWAPGYEDGGPKVKLRRFPVMFFDDGQTVAWIPARDLSKFPLYKPDPPKKADHPFHAARRWIAEREGFGDWEEREAAREMGRPEKTALVGMGPTVSSGNPVDKVEKPVSHENLENHEGREMDVNSDSDESVASSTATTETDKELRVWREKGGKIPGDGDYSGSDVDSNLDEEEMELEGDKPDALGRRWTFYPLRNTENTKTPSEAPPAGSLDPRPRIEVTTSILEGMASARKLAQQACLQPDTYSPSMIGSEAHTSTKNATSKSRPVSEEIATTSQPFDSKATKSREALPDKADSSISVADAMPSRKSLPNDIERLLEMTSNSSKGLEQEVSPSGIPPIHDTLSGLKHEDKIRSAASLPPRGTYMTEHAAARANSVPSHVVASQVQLKTASDAPAAVDEKRATVTDTPADLQANGASSPVAPLEERAPKVVDDAQADEHTVTASGGPDSKLANGGETGETMPLTLEGQAHIARPDIFKYEQSGLEEASYEQAPPRVQSPPRSATTAEASSLDSVPSASTRGPFLGAAEFEVSQYSHGDVSWTRCSGEACLKLFYSGDKNTMGTVSSSVEMTIDPAMMVGFSREPLSGSNGNSMISLAPAGGNGQAVKLVFDRSEGSPLEIGKTQSRNFIRWLRRVNPKIGCIGT